MTNQQCLAITETIAMVGRLVYFAIVYQGEEKSHDEYGFRLKQFNDDMENMKRYLKSDIDLFAEMAMKSQKLSDFVNKPKE